MMDSIRTRSTRFSLPSASRPVGLSTRFNLPPGGGSANLRDDEDQFESFKLIESRFSQVYDDSYNDDGTANSETTSSEYGEDEYFHRPRRADNYYGIRQEYLRSYTFVRDEPKPEKMKDSLRRFKAVLLAVLCCKYKKPSPRGRVLREKLSSTSSRFLHGSADYFSASCRKFAVPTCIRLNTLEVS